MLRRTFDNALWWRRSPDRRTAAPLPPRAASAGVAAVRLPSPSLDSSTCTLAPYPPVQRSGRQCGAIPASAVPAVPTANRVTSCVCIGRKGLRMRPRWLRCFRESGQRHGRPKCGQCRVQPWIHSWAAMVAAMRCIGDDMRPRAERGARGRQRGQWTHGSGPVLAPWARAGSAVRRHAPDRPHRAIIGQIDQGNAP